MALVLDSIYNPEYENLTRHILRRFCDILGQPMCLLLASGAIKYGQKNCKIFWLQNG